MAVTITVWFTNLEENKLSIGINAVAPSNTSIHFVSLGIGWKPLFFVGLSESGQFHMIQPSSIQFLGFLSGGGDSPNLP